MKAVVRHPIVSSFFMSTYCKNRLEVGYFYAQKQKEIYVEIHWLPYF
jgi:hypothetical protein